MTAPQHHDVPNEPIHGRMVLLPTPPPGGFTAEDLPRLVEVIGARFELLDGQIMMMAPSTYWHNRVIRALVNELEAIAPGAFTPTNEQGIDLGESVPEPDVMVVSSSVVTDDALSYQPRDVHLAVEVVSPGTKTKDRKHRPLQYAEAGIKHFWRVENEDGQVVVYTFELLPEGGYAPTGVFRDRVRVDRPFPIDIRLPKVSR